MHIKPIKSNLFAILFVCCNNVFKKPFLSSINCSKYTLHNFICIIMQVFRSFLVFLIMHSLQNYVSWHDFEQCFKQYDPLKLILEFVLHYRTIFSEFKSSNNQCIYNVMNNFNQKFMQLQEIKTMSRFGCQFKECFNNGNKIIKMNLSTGNAF